MKQREDLKGLANWDSHREVWVPEPGKQDEVAQKLGPTWTFDTYFGAFFGQDPPQPESTVIYPDYCGCYMCSAGSSCGGTMTCWMSNGTTWEIKPWEIKS